MMMVDKGGFTGLLMRFCGPVAFFFQQLDHLGGRGHLPSDVTGGNIVHCDLSTCQKSGQVVYIIDTQDSVGDRSLTVDVGPVGFNELLSDVALFSDNILPGSS